MKNILERIAKRRYTTKMNQRSGFWHFDLTAAAQELLAFITPKGRVLKWKVMPFWVANAPALFQERMNKILYILRCRPPVQQLISREAEMEAQINDVRLGTNTQEDHVLLFCEFVIVCPENHLRIKLEKYEFMKEEMEYLGLDAGNGMWKPAASKMQPLQDMQIRDDPKKVLHDVKSLWAPVTSIRDTSTILPTPLPLSLTSSRKLLPGGGPPERRSVSRSCRRKLPPPTAWAYPSLRVR